MCGLTGFFDDRPDLSTEQSRQLVEKMAATILHRGPDDGGSWIDASRGIALGFRRLSIVDLSPAGHQPMESASGRFEMAFNGEVYNFERIRTELTESGLAPSWRGHSDTEVMLAAFEAWGVEESLKRFIGMFAIALWDRKDQSLTLVRDRLGVKPLYYARAGSTLLFGSELKTMRAHPAFSARIDRNALALMLRHNYIPAPYTIYQNVFKLPPGTYMTVRAGDTEHKPVPYWSARCAAEEGVRGSFSGTDDEAVNELETLLKDAVGLRMIADVPLGVFLSGGIDSSLVVALMQAQSSRPVRTFSIGFQEDDYNEAQYAKAVASHLGTDHTELIVTPRQALDVIPKLPTLYDEPFSDSSQIPTYLVSELARKHVTVSLSGDGGDELFGGYTRYFWGNDIWNRLKSVPPGLRRAMATTMRSVPPSTWNGLFRTLRPVLPGKLRQTQPGNKIAKLSDLMHHNTPEALYTGLISHWHNPASLVIGSTEHTTTLTNQGLWADLPDFTRRMMYLDTMMYLPDDILVKVDRASMGVSLEAREPLLDHRVFEFAWKLPMSMKIRDGKGKWALRQVLYRHVPKERIERPKMGFGVPIDDWLRGPLKDWAEALLEESRLQREGFFEADPIQEKWREHIACKQNWQYHLWDVLMFQAWLEANPGIA